MLEKVECRAILAATMTGRLNKARPIRLGVVAAVFLFAPLLRPAEPVYQGKQLSEWLEEFSRVRQAEINHEAENAIIGMGTNALPFLVADLSSEDIPFQIGAVVQQLVAD